MKHAQYRISEFTFTARDIPPGQPLGVHFGATFLGPRDSVYTVPGFWDGDNTWRVRFSPPEAGEWSYETTSVEVASIATTPIYDSGIMKGGDEAREVDIAIDGATEIQLLVHPTEDGSDYDHSDWGGAQFVMADGTVAYLDTLTPVSASQGHGKLSLCTNIPGNPLTIAGKLFEHGLGTHSPGEILYRSPPGSKRFRAFVGVDDVVGTHGTVRFEVLRVTPRLDRIGEHDPGLHGKRGTFTVLPAHGENALFRHGGFLKVSQDGRNLTYTDGTPFFWLGDTWWFCPSDLMPLDRSTHPDIPSAYLEAVQTRERQGFTTIHMAFLGELDGISPFAGSGQRPDLSPAYWRTVDRYMDIANQHGLIPVIGVGWAGKPLNARKWQLLWRHLIARCGSHAVTWLICGEYNVKGAGDRIQASLDLGRFIKETDPYKRAMTIHPWAHGGDRRQAWDEPWYDFIMFQGGHGPVPPASMYLDAYHREQLKPILEGECRYEGIHAFRAYEIREAAFRAIQSGSFGFTYGSHGLWYPSQDEKDTRFDNWGTPTPWWVALKRPGAEHLGHLRRAYETLDWWNLKPMPDAVTRAATAPLDREVEIIHDLVESFPDARAFNAHWSRLDGTGPGRLTGTSIHLHPTMDGPAVLTFPETQLPDLPTGRQLLLVFAVGISEKANLKDEKNPSDGVRFEVLVNGNVLVDQHSHSKDWLYQAIDVSALAGIPVRVELRVTAGKNMNWDHALFRQPRIVQSPSSHDSPFQDLYTSRHLNPIFVKGDGGRTFTVYYPRKSGSEPRALHGPTPGTAYTPTWHNPRTGEHATLTPVKATGYGLLLPSPADEEDWFLVLQRSIP